MFKIGEKYIWDNGYSYMIVEYLGPSILENNARCVSLLDPDADVIIVPTEELVEYTQQQENYLKLKYNI